MCSSCFVRLSSDLIFSYFSDGIYLTHSASVLLTSFLFLKYGRYAAWNSCFSDSCMVCFFTSSCHLIVAQILTYQDLSHHRHKTIPLPPFSLLFIPLFFCTHMHIHTYTLIMLQYFTWKTLKIIEELQEESFNTLYCVHFPGSQSFS